MPFFTTSLDKYGDWISTIVLKPVVVVKLAEDAGTDGACKVTVTL